MAEIRNILQVDTILLKRGTKEALSAVLAGDNKPKSGEIIYEVPSERHPAGRLKVGDGFNDYADLFYIPDVIELNEILANVNESASNTYAAELKAREAAGTAETAAERAERAATEVKKIPELATEQVSEYMNHKVKFMSMADYNKLTSLDPECYYFITVED